MNWTSIDLQQNIFIFIDAVGRSKVDDANNATKADAGIFSVRFPNNE